MPFLFGEAQSRVVVSVSSINEAAFLEEAKKHNTKVSLLGTVNAGDIVIDNKNYGKVDEFKKPFDNTLASYFNN